MKKSIVLTLCTLVCLALSGCGKQSPSQVAEAYLNALTSGNQEKANAVSGEDLRMFNAMWAEGFRQQAKEPEWTKPNFIVLREEIDGDKAEVSLREKDGKPILHHDDEGKIDVPLKKVNGEWKVTHEDAKE